jgi:nuclear receptor subfamily 1 group I
MSYNPEKDCWQDSKCKVLLNLDVLKQAKGNIYEEHKKFIASFDSSWRSDENIMLLLSAVTLFSPERAHLVHPNVVKLEQQTYMFLLKRYLQTISPSTCEASTHYLQLISRIEELHQLNEEHVRIFLDINPGDSWPLLVEIFDFKH